MKFSSDFLANELIVGTRQYSYILCGCNVTMGNYMQIDHMAVQRVI